MTGARIRIRFISSTRERKVIQKALIDIVYVEQLVHSVLEDEGVGPVCRNLFGLKIINENIWLAPNIPIRPVVEQTNKDRPEGEPRLEIRLRFRPSSLQQVSFIDRTTFDIIFAQVHHDFMRTCFNDEERDFVLLDESVLALVALNLVRHSVEHNIGIDEILKRVNPKDFVPKRASGWQRAILFHLAEPMNLQKSLKIGFEQFENDLDKIKRKFIELFLSKVAPDYNTEVYTAYQLSQVGSLDQTTIPKPTHLLIRLRYNQSQEDASCLIETRVSTKVKKIVHHSCKQIQPREEWNQICDIETIGHATLSGVDVQIVGLKGEPIKLRFSSSKHAKSFLSAVDGYHRLMRRWNFNLCREIYSPELRFLEDIGCHGPIGYETSKRKLTDNKRPGSYLVRKCMEVSNRFLIDTLVGTRALLTIDVEWSATTKLFRKLGHSTNIKRLQVTVKTDRDEYSSLRALIKGTELRFENDPDSEGLLSSMQQLKHLIRPRESDDYPALLLSMSRRRLKELERRSQAEINGSINQLPHVLPNRLINYLGHRFPSAGNGMAVDLATLNNDQKVVVKSSDETPRRGETTVEFSFHYCPNGHQDLELAQRLRPSQIRIADWTFIKSNLFAETIGYMISGSIVQEYFPLGRLDTFFSNDPNLSQIVKLSASLQLAQALLFLCDQRIVHGKIRCRNIMVKQSHPIQIKLTDPLGSLDLELDQAFIPNEYFSLNGHICIKEFYSGLDVWAVGTTIWQIFNNGISPPSGRYANTLFRTKDCPEKVWNLIEACWIVEPSLRIPPRILHRDLFDLMAWEEGSHDYFYISQDVDPIQTNGQVNISRTADSSTSDLSTINANDSSIMSSPTSTSTNGSQADLFNNYDGPRVSQKHSNSRTYSSNNLMSSYLPTIRRPAWANMINLKRSMERYQFRGGSDVPPHQRMDFCDIFGSSFSLSSSTNPSESEPTRLVDAADMQSVSEAFERCVWHVDSKRLKLGAEIGRGSSGVVIKGFLSQPDGNELVVAVKSIEKDGSYSMDASRVQDLKREFDILKNLDHENIVKTLGYVEESKLMLIFEYMPLGSLLSCVMNLACPEDLSELPLAKYALDIASGMEYLESMKIVHRDLALRNILLKSRNEVKICDFGLAQSLGASNHYKLESDRALPLKWYAPETLATWVFTHKSDVWSYGVVLWEIYSGGDSPQYSGTYADLCETLKHERLALPRGCPRHMYDLMLSCWAYSPDERRSFWELRRILEQTQQR